MCLMSVKFSLLEMASIPPLDNPIKRASSFINSDILSALDQLGRLWWAGKEATSVLLPYRICAPFTRR